MIDPKKPVTNPALKAAAEKVRADNTPEMLNAAINELVKAILITPAQIQLDGKVPKPDAQGRIQIPKDSKVNFQILNTPDGKHYFMAFTDWEELRKWRKEPGQKTMMLRFDDFAGLLANNPNASGFVLNPFSSNLRFESGMVAAIKKKKDEVEKARKEQAVRRAQRIRPGDKVTIVEPSVYPDALLDPICEVLSKNKTVGAAYLQLMIVNDTDKSYLLVLDAPQDEKLFAEVAQAARAYLSTDAKKMDLNITISAAPLGQQGMRGSEPFYTKSQGRIRDDDEEE